jgi:hypothetical protein
MGLTRLEKLLKAPGGSPLRTVIRRAREMDDLTVRLRAVLDAEAAPHLVAANLREDGELVIVCSSPAWAARLRFESGALLEAARAGGLQALHCDVKVARR